MDQFKRLQNGMLIGPQPTEDDLRQAKREGIKTVVDFRMPNETPAPNSELVARSGLEYVNIAVNKASLSIDQVDELDRVMREKDGPFLIHCATGARAAMLPVTGQVDTLASRIQGCFLYSMNGKAPPADDEISRRCNPMPSGLPKARRSERRCRAAAIPSSRNQRNPPITRGPRRFTRRTVLCATARTAWASAPATNRYSRRCGERSRLTGAPACTSWPMRQVSSRPTCRWEKAAP